MRGRSRADRLYRLFLRLFPSEFRGDFGDDMSDVFRDERAEAAAGGRFALFRLWSRTLRGFASVAPREHAQILARDAAYGLRLMRKHPLTTAAAMFSIALGVGANTAMFTVVNAVLLQFPFKDPERVVTVLRQTPRGKSAGFTEAQFRAWNGRVDGLDSLSGYSMLSPILTGAGSATRLRLECVSASMFATLGVSPRTGRTFTEHEDGPAGEPVIVVSHGFWAGALNRDPNVIGRTLTLDGAAATVIGVMPEAFDGPRALRRLDGWIPLTFCLARQRAEGRPLRIINLYARLKPDVSPRLAEAQMDAAVEGAASSDERIRVHLSPLVEEIAGDIREPLLALLGAAGFVLLIACANVASLLIGRADARRRELAVRTALGCTRARIVRQLLTESVLFALCGGAAGLLIANWSLGTLLSVMPGYIRRIDHIALDGRVLAACVVLSTATGLLFGLLPALYASRVSPGPALKESGRWATPSRRVTRGALIVAEIALSLALLTGAGLVMKTFLHLRPANPGFEPEGKLATTISLPRSRYPDGPSQAAFLENLRQRLRDRPGVQSVVATSYLPLSGFVSTADVQPGGRDARSVTVHTPHVTADYFAEMGIPIVRGRAFADSDGPGADLAIVNETMAARMWPGEDPLGQTLLFKSRHS